MHRFLFLLALCMTTPTWALEKVRLQLLWKHQFEFAGYYAAIEKGFYRDAGLEVELREAAPGTAVVDQVIDEESEFGVATSDLVVDKANGKPVVALAAIMQHSPLALMARRDSIRQIQDLVGKRVMLGQDEATFLAFLQREGLKKGDYTLVPHSFDTADLVAGKVDAMSVYATNEPFMLNQAGFAYSLFSPRSAGIDFYTDVLFTSENLLKHKPATVAAFRDASLEGWRYAMQHPEEISDVILKKYSNRRSREHLLFEAEEMRGYMQPDLIEIGHMNPKRWKHIVQVYASLGRMPADFSTGDFIYDARPTRLPAWTMAAMAAAVGALLLIAGIAWRMASLNRALNAEILARQEAQRIASEAANNFRRLMDTAPVSVTISGMPEGTILYVNEHAQQEFGELGLKENIVGKHTFDFFRDPSQRQQLVDELVAHGIYTDREIAVFNAEGEEVDALTSARVLDFEGKPAVLAVLIDITARKRAEAAARANAENFRRLMDSAPVAILISETDGKIMYVNDYCLREFGRLGQVESIIGRHTFDFFRDPGRRQQLAEELATRGMYVDQELKLFKPGGDPIDFLASARIIEFEGRPAVHTVLIDITERNRAESALRASEANAQDANAQLRLQLEENAKLQTALKEQAIRDSLTGFYNRRYLDETMEREISRARREGKPLSVVMFDIDHFKNINDTYGHRVGDEALRTLADLLRQDVRIEDIPYRYGGEEFLVLMPHMPLAAAVERAEHWRRMIASTPLTTAEGTEIKLTVSMGIATFPEHGSTPDDLTQHADLALYTGKRRGRNRVVVYDNAIATTALPNGIS